MDNIVLTSHKHSLIEDTYHMIVALLLPNITLGLTDEILFTIEFRVVVKNCSTSYLILI
jgi:hypothetical protein